MDQSKIAVKKKCPKGTRRSPPKTGECKSIKGKTPIVIENEPAPPAPVSVSVPVVAAAEPDAEPDAEPLELKNIETPAEAESVDGPGNELVDQRLLEIQYNDIMSEKKNLTKEMDEMMLKPTAEREKNKDIFKKLETDIKKNDILLQNFFRQKELLNRENLKQDNEYNYLYPNLDDAQFNIKIAERKEFADTKYDGAIYDIESQAELLCNAEFELAPHQSFVRNFLSFQTPYNSLLLYHGLGTGKTCSAIVVAEEMRDYMTQLGINSKIIVVASPNVQNNFKLQLFDESKLQEVEGLWNIRSCTGNKLLKEINPTNMKGLTRENIVSQIKHIIGIFYEFMGYVEFANYIDRVSNTNSEGISESQQKNTVRNKLRKRFNNSLIIIDEVHNIRITDDNPDKRVASELFKLVKNAANLRILLLSATPMYNSYKEIIWLINLMNLNDKRSMIEVRDVFNANGSFKLDKDGTQLGRELLERKATGYISFVRGENPYTFPYRIWPSEFAPENTFLANAPPRVQLNGNPLVQNIEFLSLFLNKIGSYQQTVYNSLIQKLKGKKNQTKENEENEDNEMPSFDNMEGVGYTLLQKPIEALNMVYPDKRFKVEGSNIDSAELVGKEGLARIMTFTEATKPPSRHSFEYREDNGFGKIFSPQELPKYSGKIANICKRIMNSIGVVLVYSQYIDGGVLPIALALEELGFSRSADVQPLFKTPPTEKIDALTFKTRKNMAKEHEEGSFSAARYVMITGDKTLTPDIARDLRLLTAPENKDGRQIKVVLISQTGAEGLDFKFIRQVHILEPWYNTSRTEQIIGRAVRTCSHKLLPFVKRNVEIYLHGTILEQPEEEAVDLYVYRLAELKAVQIGQISRLLKEISVDCLLNFDQTGFTEEQMNQTVKQELSSGKIINYKVGDKPFSSTCDYQKKCAYTCNPTKAITEEEVNLDTYSEQFIMMNTDKITHKIRLLFKERFFYQKGEMVSHINAVRKYPLVQINAALSQLVEDKNEYITDRYGRIGNLINIADMYLFQPVELNNPHSSILERSVPLEFKHDTLAFNLPKNVSEAILEEHTSAVGDETALIKKLEKLYELTLIPHVIKRGEDNWYKFCSEVIKEMETKEGISREILLDFIVAHMIEELDFAACMDLLQYLNNLAENSHTPFTRLIEKYFNTLIITSAKGLVGLLLQNNGKIQLVIKNLSSNWHLAEGEDYNELAPYIKKIADRLLPARSKLNTFVGFMAIFKKNDMVFKVKDITKPRDKGYRCDQTSKKYVITLLNKIVGTDKFQFGIVATHTHLCILQEFYLRFYNREKRDGKVWFLTPSEAVLINIEKVQ